jgi:hypothetical protein
MMEGSVADIDCATDDPWRMEPTDRRIAASAPIATGSRVHVSDASPRGYFGRVTSTNAGMLTIARDDTGARAVVDLSRRRVFIVDR